jgi:hypothetical protein
MGGRCLNSKRAARSARSGVQRSGRKIRHDIRGLNSSAFTITKLSAGAPSIALPMATVPMGNGIYAAAVQTQLGRPSHTASTMTVRPAMMRSNSTPPSPSMVTFSYHYALPQAASPPQPQYQQAYTYGASPYGPSLQQMQAQSMAQAAAHGATQIYQTTPYGNVGVGTGYISPPLASPPIMQHQQYPSYPSRPSSSRRSHKSSRSVTSTPPVYPISPPLSPTPVGGGYVLVGTGQGQVMSYPNGPPNDSNHETQSFFGSLGLGLGLNRKSSPRKSISKRSR